MLFVKVDERTRNNGVRLIPKKETTFNSIDAEISRREIRNPECLKDLAFIGYSRRGDLN